MMTVSMQQINSEIQHQEWNAAATDLKAGLQQHPQSAKGWYYLAQVEGKMNHLAEAKTALAHADSIDPTHGFAGNMSIYNGLYNRVNYSQAAQMQTPAPVNHVASVQHQSYPSNAQSSNGAIWIGASITVFVIILFLFFLKKKNTVVAAKPVTMPEPLAATSGASPSRATVIDRIRNTPASQVPEPYVQPRP